MLYVTTSVCAHYIVAELALDCEWPLPSCLPELVALRQFAIVVENLVAWLVAGLDAVVALGSCLLDAGHVSAAALPCARQKGIESLQVLVAVLAAADGEGLWQRVENGYLAAVLQGKWLVASLGVDRVVEQELDHAEVSMIRPLIILSVLVHDRHQMPPNLSDCPLCPRTLVPAHQRVAHRYAESLTYVLDESVGELAALIAELVYLLPHLFSECVGMGLCLP